MMNATRRSAKTDGKGPPVCNLLVSPALPFFLDWLVANVHAVESKTDSGSDTYNIFGTKDYRRPLLTRSLRACDSSPGFLQLRENDALSFRALAEFRSSNLDAQQMLCEQPVVPIWDPLQPTQAATS
jgi:hypothetical protein